MQMSESTTVPLGINLSKSNIFSPREEQVQSESQCFNGVTFDRGFASAFPELPSANKLPTGYPPFGDNYSSFHFGESDESLHPDPLKVNDENNFPTPSSSQYSFGFGTPVKP